MTDRDDYAEHLGDGVYASFDGYQIWLAADHHNNKVMALEPEVFRNLIQYEKALKAKLQADKEREASDQ